MSKEDKQNCELDEESIALPVASPFGPASPIISVKNHVYLYDDINVTTARALFSVLHETAMDIINTAIENNMSIVPIVLHVNSNGGEVSAGMGIIRCIQDIQNGTIHQLGGIPIKIPVHTIIEGEADSMASLIACVGTKRLMSKNALSLLHDVRQMGGLAGKVEDIQIASDNLALYKTQMHSIYIENSRGKLTEEKLSEICKDEKYSTPDQLLEWGLIDEII